MLLAAVALGVLLIWGWPTGPKVNEAGWGVVEEYDAEGLLLWLGMCEGRLDEVQVRETADEIRLTVHASEWEERSDCALPTLVHLDQAPGDRFLLDRSGWFRIPRRVVVYDLG